MIDPRSRSLEWIQQAKQNIPGVSDTPLVEKAIRDAALIEDQSLNKLNRIKKISLEAFFYCRELEKLQ